MDLLPKPDAVHHQRHRSLLNRTSGDTSASQWSSLATQRSAAAREQEDAETIALQRSALQSASAMIRTLQERLQLLESASTTTPTATTSRFIPSPPPASTSSSASLRLQALAHGLHTESLRQQVEEVQSRSQSRAASDAGDIAEEREIRSESEIDDSEDEAESEDEDTDASLLTEMDSLRWVHERRLEDGEVDADGVAIKRRRTSAFKSRQLGGVRERAGR